MIAMPNSYKQSMHDVTKRRNQSYMLVTIGVINQEAQKSAKVTAEYGAAYSYLSNKTRLLDNYDVEFEYATMEQDWFKTDGKMLFPPRPDQADYLFNAGVVTDNLLGSICFRFNAPYNIRGLTIDFGRNYPVDFAVSNGTKTASFKGAQHWTTEEIFDGTEYLLITPKKMVNGQGRLRIEKILMGVGISFENKKILSSSKSEHLSPIMEELPSLDFSLSVDNANRQFDVENKASAINYLEIGQEVVVRYGYDINDDGNITWLDGCVCDLTDWSADDEKMSFSARDKIDALDETYYRGQYYADGISLYDLAVDVLTDAGLDGRHYSLDQYLQTMIIHNPLPCVTHKECLQLIANAGRCKLYTDRSGLICITAAFVTVISPDRMQVESQNVTPWSDLQAVVNGAVLYEYATMSQDHIRTDGSMYFLPRSGSYLPAGFASEAVSDADGNFADNPKFKISLEAATTYFSLQLNFTANPAQSVVIHTYHEGGVQESYTVSNLELENLIEHEFPIFDAIEFEFVKGQPNSRIFVSSVVFGDVTDYRMDYHIMTKSPKGIQEEKTARVDVLCDEYNLTDEIKNIFSETVDVTDCDTYTFVFTDPSYDVTVKADNALMTIVDSSSYFVTVDTAGLTGDHAFVVDGKAYVITTKMVSKAIEVSGNIEQWSNPLIDENLARLQVDWLANYFANNVEYEISYRGEPRLDAGDIVFLENDYVNNLQIQLYEHKLNFNGALSGSVKARRAVSGEVR